MADYSGVILLSQPPSPTSGDDLSEHTLLSFPTLYASDEGGGIGGNSSKSKTPCNKILTIDNQYHHHHLLTPSSETTVRKPRGRPQGSKNKPKPPLVITRDTDSTMEQVILEISAGYDVIDCIISFARRDNVDVTIMSATGSISNVTLQNPVYHVPSLSLHGPLGILSLSGSFIASNKTIQSSSSCSFGVTVARAQGQVFGGIVGGKLTVATKATVVAATFISPDFHRLPCEADNEVHHRQETKSDTHGVGGGATEYCSSNGMSMLPDYSVAVPTPLNCQISPDVMLWDPSSRP